MLCPPVCQTQFRNSDGPLALPDPLCGLEQHILLLAECPHGTPAPDVNTPEIKYAGDGAASECFRCGQQVHRRQCPVIAPVSGQKQGVKCQPVSVSGVIVSDRPFSPEQFLDPLPKCGSQPLPVKFSGQRCIGDGSSLDTLLQPGADLLRTATAPVLRTVLADYVFRPVSEPAEDGLPSSSGRKVGRRHHLPLQFCQGGVLEKILCHTLVLSGQSSDPEKGRPKRPFPSAGSRPRPVL